MWISKRRVKLDGVRGDIDPIENVIRAVNGSLFCCG